jgi:hypothetical protein
VMYRRGKSDSAIVARPGDRLRSRWSKGRRPKGMQTSKPRAGHRTGKACHKRWDAYGKPQGKERRSGSPRSSITSVLISSG